MKQNEKYVSLLTARNSCRFDERFTCTIFCCEYASVADTIRTKYKRTVTSCVYI